MLLSLAEIKAGRGGAAGTAAANIKVVGENALHPYKFSALYLKPYVTPFLAFTRASRPKVLV